MLAAVSAPAAVTRPAPVVAAAPVATAPVATAPAAAWYPDPSDAGSLRWWDGASWTEHRSPAAGGPAAGGDHGRFVGAIPNTVGSKGRIDVLVYERALVFSRVTTTDAAVVGFLLGWLTVSPVLGYIVGDYVGARSNAARIAALASRHPGEVAAAHRHNALVPVAAITRGRARVTGRAGGSLDLRTADGARYKRRWTRPHTRGNDVGTLLGGTLQHRVAVKRSSALRSPGMVVVLSLLLVVASVVAVVSFTGGGTAASGRARQQVAAVCAPYLAMWDRAAGGTVPTREELIALTDPMVVPFSRAAAYDSRYEAARDAAQELRAQFTRPPEAFDADRGAVAVEALALACSL